MNKKMVANSFIPIEGLVAAGLDPSGAFLLVISHAGSAVYCTTTFERLAFDDEMAYPVNGIGIGIGPLEGLGIAVRSIDEDTLIISLILRTKQIVIRCKGEGIEISNCPDLNKIGQTF